MGWKAEKSQDVISVSSLGATVVTSKRLTKNFRTRQEKFPKVTGGWAKKKGYEEWTKQWKEELLAPFLGLLGIQKPEKKVRKRRKEWAELCDR